MRLIKRIEIHGFRGMDSVDIQSLDELNIVFGRNDSGKSNVLRALNLFFNGETNPGRSWSADRDVYSGRKKRQAWMRVYFHKISRYSSLGDSFYVKKTWKAGKPRPEVEAPSEVEKKYWSRFLNNIDYYYIPAIKSDAIFQHLLGKVYEILIADSQFQDSLTQFAGEVAARTQALSESIGQNVKVRSLLAPPTDLADLFRALDFVTGEKEQYSLLLQRGDGVKVRHIPEILAFVCAHRKNRYQVWGFEEPENSLEYAAAIEEATAFQRHAKDHQVIITSHSPAFYNLRDKNVSRYYVARDAPARGGRSHINHIDSEEGASLMNESGLLAAMALCLDEVRQEIAAREKATEELRRRLEKIRQQGAILFVEGESDANIVQAAWRAAHGSRRPPFEVVPAGGTMKMDALAKEGVVINRLAGERLIFALADNDPEGRAISRNKVLNAHPTNWQRFPNGVYWARLACSDVYTKEVGAEGIRGPHNWSFTIEHIFPGELVEEAMEAGVYGLGKPEQAAIDHCWDKIRDRTGHVSGRFFFKPHPEIKVAFSEWIAKQKLGPDSFGCLPELLAGISALCKTATESATAAQ